MYREFGTYLIAEGLINIGFLHLINGSYISQVLYLGHPRNKIRDTSKYKPFRQLFQGRTPSLKKLTAMLLNVKVQEGEHNSVSILLRHSIYFLQTVLEDKK